MKPCSRSAEAILVAKIWGYFCKFIDREGELSGKARLTNCRNIRLTDESSTPNAPRDFGNFTRAISAKD